MQLGLNKSVDIILSMVKYSNFKYLFFAQQYPMHLPRRFSDPLVKY